VQKLTKPNEFFTITQPISFEWRFNGIISLLPNLTRLAITVVFHGSLFLQLIKDNIMLALEKIVQSDKPVFTVVCGGTAGVVSTILELVKLVRG